MATELRRLRYPGRGESPTDPDERSLAGVIPLVGEDKFFWASDFPHPDHAPRYLTELAELVALLPPSARYKLMGDNVRSVYGLPARAAG